MSKKAVKWNNIMSFNFLKLRDKLFESSINDSRVKIKQKPKKQKQNHHNNKKQQQKREALPSSFSEASTSLI